MVHLGYSMCGNRLWMRNLGRKYGRSIGSYNADTLVKSIFAQASQIPSATADVELLWHTLGEGNPESVIRLLDTNKIDVNKANPSQVR